MKKLLIVAALFIVLNVGLYWYNQSVAPQIGGNLALQAVNGSTQDFYNAHAFENVKALPVNTINLWLLISVSLYFLLSYRPKRIVQMALIAGCVGLTGCRQPFDVPEYSEVAPNETAFMITLEGDAKEQAKFDSEDLLNRSKIASKKIQIPHRWESAGYETLGWDGKWVPTKRVIKVDRTPITVKWEAPENRALKGGPQDTAIWIESRDSVGFSMGFSVSAQIMEKDTARFLYQYTGNGLAVVLNTEVRARVQQDAAEVAAQYILDDLRSRKQEMIDAVRKDVIPYFQEKGITITTVGMFGGMTYENPEIQSSIDKVFVAQQEKATTLARKEAQINENARIISESTARADALLQEAGGKSKAAILEAEGKAKALTLESDAAAKAQNNSVYLALRALEVQKAQVEKWNGAFPSYYIGGPANLNGLLTLPNSVPAK